MKWHWTTAIGLIVLAAGVLARADGPTTRPDDAAADLDALMQAAERNLQRQQQQQARPAAPGEQRPDQPAAEGADKPADQPGGLDTGDEEEDDLVSMLLEKAGGEGGRSIMQEIIHNMSRSREQLREKFDPGRETQVIQEKIIKDLDQAIEMAQQSQGGGQGQGQGQGQRQGRGQRQQSRSQGQGQSGSGQPQTNRSGSPAGSEVASHGQVQEGQRNADIREGRTGWGGLPPRDREEVVQGQNEQWLPRWRAIIEKYYTALQVQSEKDRN